MKRKVFCKKVDIFAKKLTFLQKCEKIAKKLTNRKKVDYRKKVRKSQL